MNKMRQKGQGRQELRRSFSVIYSTNNDNAYRGPLTWKRLGTPLWEAQAFDLRLFPEFITCQACGGRDLKWGGGMVCLWDPSSFSFFWALTKSPMLGGQEGKGVAMFL